MTKDKNNTGKYINYIDGSNSSSINIFTNSSKDGALIEILKKYNITHRTTIISTKKINK